MRYVNRADAGQRLAPHLDRLCDSEVVVLGVPRGGVRVASEVARHLGAPLDLAVVRKLHVPWQPELGFGALGEHGVRVVDEDIVRESGLSTTRQESVERTERAELDRWVRRWRSDRTPIPLASRGAVVVHDAVATGAAAEAACRVARARGAARVVLAVPVAQEDALTHLRAVADEVVCPQPVHHIGSAGGWYEDFAPVGDAEISGLLTAAARPVPAEEPGLPPKRPPLGRAVEVPASTVRMPALFTLPPTARGVVIVVSLGGDGPGPRHDPGHEPGRDHLAGVLHRAALGTLLLDPLTGEEGRTPHNLYDITLLARRLHAAAAWLRGETGLPVSYCAADTGAGAALAAAAEGGVRAVVCVGGRPELAGPAALARVDTPTLLVVGALDTRRLGCNRLAADWMHCEHRVEVVPDATDLFAEPDALDVVTGLTRDWITAHLAMAGARALQGTR
ncbi:phosphoribosyltransferase family protein [Streptomyces sp. NPDC006743]|uniref:phosphoribosyltransferase family protein n=1 Tax=Streptomyces sp. NPDC006743 TaxID=3154480 RepID=UPI003453531E